MIKAQTLVEAIQNQNIREMIAEEPKMYKFLKSKKEQDIFISGYNYALRDFQIIIEKLSALVNCVQSHNGDEKKQ